MMLKFAMDTQHIVKIPCQDVHLDGLLHIPVSAQGLVIFVHGSGSSRFSPRNQQVANFLQQAKFATLLFDLLTQEEDLADSETMAYRFDIPFLTTRLLVTTHWLLEHPVLSRLPFAYFGASTGGGAALLAAAQEPKLVKAVVSRGGRPDLAGDEALSQVKAATLLIVGEADKPVIQLNEKAFAKLTCEKKMEIVPGATHLFEEPGKLHIVADLALKWFEKYLR